MKPDEWLFQPSWLSVPNYFLKWVRLRVYLAVTPRFTLRLRITQLDRPAKPKDEV